MGLKEKLPSGVLLTTVEGVAGYMCRANFWPSTFGLACCEADVVVTTVVRPLDGRSRPMNESSDILPYDEPPRSPATLPHPQSLPFQES